MSLVSDLVAQKSARTALVVGAALAYALLCAVLAQPVGSLGIDRELAELYLLLAGWTLGLVVLLLFDHPSPRYAASSLTMIKAIWLNLGVVVTAFFVPPEVRVLLLVVPLFGVLYAALHLSRRQVASVTLITWLSYLLGSLLLMQRERVAAEGTLVLAFSLMLIAMFYMASEITSLRHAFERRRQRLDAAMQKLSDLALRDDLTGLYNRRYIMEVLNRQKALADRGHVGFTICYCDLDNFKVLNDRFGHQAGDRMLTGFAGIAEQVIRSVDFAARIGGEEFLLVLVDADAEVARHVATRLGQRTRTLPVVPEVPDYVLTVSMGIAEFRPGESVEELIQRADRAMYEAKAQGRDRIVIG